MDPEITLVEQLMWTGGCWNKSAFEQLPHDAFCYPYLHTCTHYSDDEHFGIGYIACVRNMQILPFFFL